MLVYRQAGSTGSGGGGAPTMAGAFIQQTVHGGDTEIIEMTGASLPCTVTANPLNGDTLTISFSTDDGTNYQAWAAGTAGLVTAITAVVFDFPVTHIKAVCAGTGVASVVTVC